MSLSLRFASTATRTASKASVLPALESISAGDLFQKPQPKSYFVQRTSQGNLPIYKTYRSQTLWTDVKRIQGDLVSFRNDVQHALAADNIAFNSPDFICMLQSGTLRVKGDYAQALNKVLSKVF